jgi:NodT family efflux transporter outer membrane factor (OMF) lipoprotein
MDEALAHSPSMAQAQARLQIAEARAGNARSALYPSLSANGGATEQKLTYNGIFPKNAVPRDWNDMGRLNLDFSWELDFWGKNRAALAAALSEACATQADAAAARLLLTTAMADSYIRLEGFYSQRDIAVEALRNRRDSEQLVLRRVADGLDAQGSVELAKARTSLAQADVSELDEELELTRNGIAALLGQGPDRGLSIERPRLMAHRAFGLPDHLKLDLVGRKPEIVAARLRVEAAAKRIGVAKAAFYPNVNLTGIIGFESLGLSRLFDSGSDTGAVGPAIHLPLFEGGRLHANLGQARAEYEFAVAAYNEALTQALRGAADAARSLQALPIRTQFVDTAVERSGHAYQLARQRYEGGLADYQSVLTAEDTALRAQSADRALRVRGLSLAVAFAKALGGGFEDVSTTQQALLTNNDR